MNRALWEQRLQSVWYGRSSAWILLWPVSCLYCTAVRLRRLLYRAGLLRTVRLASRVIVVGNITVGGTGKTPLVIALAQRLQQAGLRVGIVTRGYRGAARDWPRQADAAGDPQQLGDEAVLLARKTRVPVFAGPDRVAAGKALLQAAPCDVLICDDGLQHYALQRDVEIAMVDATRDCGNGLCLPAGPLREPVARLREVDAIVRLGDNSGQGHCMRLSPGDARRICAPDDARSLESFRGGPVHAVAGIGNPEGFFSMLRAAGLDIRPQRFADHHPFQPSDLAFAADRPVLMTEKDALKCELFAQDNWWFVPVAGRLDAAFYDWLLGFLN